MLIVDVPEDYSLPTALKEMPEIPMVVQNINVPRLRDPANVSKDEVTNYIDHNFKRTNVTTSSEILMLVNMQFMPLVRMEVNKWYRWRIGRSQHPLGPCCSGPSQDTNHPVDCSRVAPLASAEANNALSIPTLS